MSRNEKIKQSLLLGALASSFGIFVSKLLGIFYYAPLSDIAGENNMIFYSTVYSYYDLLLQISTAGIPFAIATLVARFNAKKDYKTVLLVKNMGASIIMGLSFITALIFLLVATPLAKQSLGANAPIEDIENLRNLFYVLTIAVISVPLLGALRGYIQGLKGLDVYAGSQVLEQFVRVFAILFGSYFVVRVMLYKTIYAIYVAVAAAALGAIIAILFVLRYTRKETKHIKTLIKENDDIAITKKQLFNEIIALGIPYLIITFLGSAGPIVNTLFFMDYVTKVNGPEVYEASKVAAGILQANIAKVSNIPSVLALGFGSGMVPYLTESLEENDNEKITKQINQILDASTFALVPTILIFIFFAKDIYYVLYGASYLELGAQLFKVSNIQIFLGTIAPIFSSIMMSLKLKGKAIFTLIISFIVKLVSFFPFVYHFGVYGMIYSSGLYYLLQILMYFYYLKVNFNINIKDAYKKFAMITACSFVAVLPAYYLHQSVYPAYSGRFQILLALGGLGCLMLAIYYFVTSKTGLLKNIFGLENVSLKSIVSKIKS